MAGSPQSHEKPPPKPFEFLRAEPYVGRFRDVKNAIRSGTPTRALDTALAWHRQAPRDAFSLIALGEALEAKGDFANAARSYGSIIDLFPARAELRRIAGELLERLDTGSARSLAIDTYARVAKQHGDDPSSHRLLAFARLRAHDFAGAFDALQADRYRNDRIRREDLGLVAAAWKRAEPGRKNEIENRLSSAGGTPEDRPSIRFVLHWEMNPDVNLHVLDATGNDAYWLNRFLPSGGEHYGGITAYGPQCFTVRGASGRRAGPYTLRVVDPSYAHAAPIMGTLQIIDHDGDGHLTIENRPFVIISSGAYIDLGVAE